MSSSISVTSVPTDVTGDGPTMSLGLMRLLKEFPRLLTVDDGRLAAAEPGRKFTESMEVVDLKKGQELACIAHLDIRADLHFLKWAAYGRGIW